MHPPPRPRAGRSGRSPVSTLTSRPNLSVQERRICPPWPLLPGATVKMKAPPSVEEPPRAFQYRSATGEKRLSSSRKAAQRGVDGLLLGADQADLDLAGVGEREHLRAQHRRVGDAQQLERWSPLLRAMMKNQGPSGDAWMWVAWICR